MQASQHNIRMAIRLCNAGGLLVDGEMAERRVAHLLALEEAAAQARNIADHIASNQDGNYRDDAARIVQILGPRRKPAGRGVIQAPAHSRPATANVLGAGWADMTLQAIVADLNSKLEEEWKLTAVMPTAVRVDPDLLKMLESLTLNRIELAPHTRPLTYRRYIEINCLAGVYAGGFMLLPAIEGMPL